MTAISGELFDGLSTTPISVGLSLGPHELQVQLPGVGDALAFKYPEIRGLERTGRGFRCVLPRYNTQEESHWVLDFQDPAFYLELKRQLHKNHGFVKRSFTRLGEQKVWALLALTLLGLALFFLLASRGLQHAYRLTPVAYDLRLGHQVDSTLARFYQPCKSPAIDTFFQKALTQLTLPTDHFPHRVIVLDDSVQNAMALPGGTIYVYRGLLEKSSSPDEVLGVLGHELSHSELRHTVRQIIQSTGASYLLTLTIGMAIDGMDMLEGLESSLEMSSILLTMRYSRGFESEADSQGIVRMHHAQQRVGPLDTLLTRISPKPRPRDRLLAWFSTHPLSKERTHRFTAAQAQENFPSDTVFASERLRWDALKHSCPLVNDSIPLWKKILR